MNLTIVEFEYMNTSLVVLTGLILYLFLSTTKYSINKITIVMKAIMHMFCKQNNKQEN